MPFQPFAGMQSPHIDLSMHPATGVVTITVAFHPDNRGGYNCRVYALPPPYTGVPILLRDWQQGQPGMLGPFGHGASMVLPSGALLVAVPLGIDGPNNVTPTLLLEPNYSPPYALGGSGVKGDKGDPGIQGVPGTPADPALGLAVAQLQKTAALQQQQITELETALGNVSGGLSEADADLLAWVARWRMVLATA